MAESRFSESSQEGINTNAPTRGGTDVVEEELEHTRCRAHRLQPKLDLEEGGGA